MKVFIVGGTGLLGSNAAVKFIELGHEVSTIALELPNVKLPKELQVDIGNYLDLSDDELELLRKGVVIEEKKTKEAFIERIDSNSFIIKISEGRNRQIRKMFESINYKVIDLKRIAIGNIQLGNLKEGSFRKLSNSEINYLRSL